MRQYLLLIFSILLLQGCVTISSFETIDSLLSNEKVEAITEMPIMVKIKF